jgi:hypothetical protein
MQENRLEELPNGSMHFISSQWMLNQPVSTSKLDLSTPHVHLETQSENGPSFLSKKDHGSKTSEMAAFSQINRIRRHHLH